MSYVYIQWFLYTHVSLCVICLPDWGIAAVALSSEAEALSKQDLICRSPASAVK